MKGKLFSNLYQYIRENNPDVLIELEESGGVTKYLSDKVSTVDPLLEQLAKENKPAYIIEELCMGFLTEDLKPSRYNYILNILESEFENKYNQFIESGIVVYEVCNIIKCCQPVFNEFNFSEENEDNRFLRYAITGVLADYQNGVTSEIENVSNELQQSTEIKR
jgi:Domain of unknown function (DUF1896)